MNLIMITPHVGTSNTLLSFIPTWIRALAKQVDKLWVISPRVEEISVPDNVELYQVGRDYDRAETIFHAFGNFQKVMWELTRQNNVGGIFAHMYPKFALLAAPYTMYHRIPLILWYTHKSVSLQLRIANYLVDNILTAAHGTCNLRSIKVKSVGHGIDTNVFRRMESRITKQEETLVSVGRISRIKNLETIISAIDLLRRKPACQDIKLYLVGEPPFSAGEGYLRQLEAVVKARGLSNHIQFIGRVEHQEIPNLLNRCSLFINAGNSGVDKATLEAMACELPVLVSYPAFQSILGEHAQTLMYPPNDAPILSERIKQVLDLPIVERVRMGQDLRKIIVDHHNVIKLTGKIIETFHNVH